MGKGRIRRSLPDFAKNLNVETRNKEFWSKMKDFESQEIFNYSSFGYISFHYSNLHSFICDFLKLFISIQIQKIDCLRQFHWIFIIAVELQVISFSVIVCNFNSKICKIFFKNFLVDGIKVVSIGK